MLHVGRDAAYVALDGFCLGVLSRAATHVPCGILTANASLVGLGPGRADVGDPVWAGEGRLRFGDADVVVSRMIDASAPKLTPMPGLGARLAHAVPMEVVTDELPEDALDALRAADPDAVLPLLGRGGGLTPLGDDVLCGWLATALATGRDVHQMTDQVTKNARTRTTLLSATLLDCAARGEVIPQFRALLHALAAGEDPAAPVADLVRVGHTSGVGLAAGCLLALSPTPTTEQPADEGNR